MIFFKATQQTLLFCPTLKNQKEQGEKKERKLKKAGGDNENAL